MIPEAGKPASGWQAEPAEKNGKTRKDRLLFNNTLWQTCNASKGSSRRRQATPLFGLFRFFRLSCFVGKSGEPIQIVANMCEVDRY